MTEPDPYADMPYPSPPIRCSHPEILAVAGAVAGLRPAPIDRCRVLEIGCGEGGNLLPMAAGLPGSEFVGIDPSGPAIARASRQAEQLGLRNVALSKKGVEDLDDGTGSFDYIITHGVFSWVATELQEKILEVSRRLLRPDGLAYVSYNTYPGWHVRGMMREMMLYHVRNESSPAASVTRARELLAQLGGTIGTVQKLGPWATELDALGALLRHESEFLSRFPDAYVYHDHLERVNLPVYFHEFVARAGRHGLRYVSEGLFSSGRLESYPAHVADAVRSFAKDPIEVQQYLDFVMNRAFRQSVLCIAGPVPAPDPGRLRGFHISSPAKRVAREGERDTFTGAGGVSYFSAVPAVKAALEWLGEQWPSAASFETLEAVVRERTGADPRNLVELMFQLLAAGMVEFQSAPPRFTREIGARPTASRMARVQARTGHVVTNLRHEQVALDVLTQSALPLVDGTRDEAQLLAGLEKVAGERKIVAQTNDGAVVIDPVERARILAQTLQLFLRHLADSALLEAR